MTVERISIEGGGGGSLVFSCGLSKQPGEPFLYVYAHSGKIPVDIAAIVRQQLQVSEEFIYYGQTPIAKRIDKHKIVFIVDSVCAR